MTELSSKDKYWYKLADISRRTLIPTIGALLLIANGPGILDLSDTRDTLAASTSRTCYSNLTAQKTTDKYPTLYFSDASARQIGVCSKPVCRYQGWGADVGKSARICFSGEVLISIEIEGVSRLTRDGLLSELSNLILWHKIAFTAGLVCLAIFAFMERKGLVLVLRGEGH